MRLALLGMSEQCLKVVEGSVAGRSTMLLLLQAETEFALLIWTKSGSKNH